MSGEVVEATARKRCSTCERVLDVDEFSPKKGGVYAACKDCRRLKVRIATPRLPAEPLAQWVAQRLFAEGIWDLVAWAPIPDHRAPRNIEEIARDWGTSAKRLQDILKGRVSTVSEDYADRVLTGAGSPHLLAILWDDEESLAA